MSTLSFRARIRIIGVNPYVLVSAARAAALKPGWRRPLPVCIRIDGHPRTPWRINLMPRGDGSFYLYLHGGVRQASGTTVGDVVAVEIAFDAGYRGGPAQRIPPWFRKPLAADPRAAAAWKELPPSRQKEIVRYLVRLKSPEARAR
ncbi:MAG TPA: YdeI/OmpD-associated family protein, partial [Gemmatimonadales bacterium]|nr:YdeI/OmpD-associated family protein [Gemmatimonadales bacterium]